MLRAPTIELKQVDTHPLAINWQPRRKPQSSWPWRAEDLFRGPLPDENQCVSGA